MRRWTVIVFLIAIIVVGFVARKQLVHILPGWAIHWLVAPEAVERSNPVRVNVLVSTARDGSLPVVRRTIGTVVPVLATDVSAPASGMVMELAARDGAQVKSGALLARLDDRVISANLERDRAQLAKDQAALEDAQKALDRLNSLRDSGADSPQERDDAEARVKESSAAVDVSKATLAADAALLAQTEIRAPFDGRLGAFLISPGAFATPGTPIVRLTQTKPVYAEFTLAETDLRLVHAAFAAGRLSARYSPMLLGGNHYSAGPIVFVDTTVDPASATFKLRAELPNEEGTLWPGQALNIQVDAGTVDNLVLVPLVAIQSQEDGAICYVVRPDKTVEVRRVDVALRVGDDAGVVRGLKAGDMVVVEGQASLEDGAAVVVQQAKALKPEPAAKSQVAK